HAVDLLVFRRGDNLRDSRLIGLVQFAGCGQRQLLSVPTDDARDVGERDCAKLLDNAFDGDAEARGAFGDLFDRQWAGISRPAARALWLRHLFNPDCCSVPEPYHINPILSSEQCTVHNFSHRVWYDSSAPSAEIRMPEPPSALT